MRVFMTTATKSILYRQEEKISHIILNRPQTRNAFDDELIQDFTTLLQQIENDRNVRVVVLQAEGKIFCAGADLNWMKKTANFSEEENFKDAMSLATLLHKLATLAQPTICLVQGGAYGGGVGLAAACDITIAEPDALFALSEVKIGLVPAVISPYVNRAMGKRHATRYYLTGERFDSETARRLGLIHEISKDLQNKGEEIAHLLLKNSPMAMECVKKRLSAFSSEEHLQTMEQTAKIIAGVRVSREGREGIASFLEKRTPNWNI